MDNNNAHALLGPSSAARWMNCTRSARECEHVPDNTSTFAEEGTLAHAMASKILKTRFALPSGDEDADITRLSADYYTPDMDAYVKMYTDYVEERCAEAMKGTKERNVAVETRLDLNKWIPQSFGTADAMIVADGVLEVIDLKYGMGVPVSAENNAQLMCYALGGVDYWDYLYDIKTVRMTIVQPRLGNVSTWTIPLHDLLVWGNNELIPAALMAFNGKGGFACGEWCRFCKIRATCKQRAMTMLYEHWDISGEKLTPKVMATRVLPILAPLKNWLSCVETETLNNAIEGTEYPGYEVREGKGRRVIKDQLRAAGILNEAGLCASDIYAERKLKGITALERLVGKNRLMELIGDCVEVEPGAPKLVPVKDKKDDLFNEINLD